MWERRLTIFLVVLLVASSFAWALPGAKKKGDAQVAVTEEVQGTSTSVESQPLTESEVKEISTNLTKLSTLLEENNVLFGNKMDAVKEAAADVSYDLNANNLLIAAQMEQIESLKKELKQTRFFADLGVAFGFEEKTITYGAVADMGMKLGSGLLLKTGVQYMVGNFSNIRDVKWSLDNLTVSATVGWEW